MPDSTFAVHWPTELATAEAFVTGPDPYQAGWIACREWESVDPPEELSPAEQEQWREGWWAAFDSPLGERCPQEFER